MAARQLLCVTEHIPRILKYHVCNTQRLQSSPEKKFLANDQRSNKIFTPLLAFEYRSLAY